MTKVDYIFMKNGKYLKNNPSPAAWYCWEEVDTSEKATGVETLDIATKMLIGVAMSCHVAYKVKELEGATIIKRTTTTILEEV